MNDSFLIGVILRMENIHQQFVALTHICDSESLWYHWVIPRVCGIAKKIVALVCVVSINDPFIELSNGFHFVVNLCKKSVAVIFFVGVSAFAIIDC